MTPDSAMAPVPRCSVVRRAALWLFALTTSGVLPGLMCDTTVCRLDTDRANRDRARADLRFLGEQVRLFELEQGRLPDSLRDLVERPPFARDWPSGGYLERMPQDPWGTAYVLQRPLLRGEVFDVVSWGADGQSGGDGIEADIMYRVPDGGEE